MSKIKISFLSSLIGHDTYNKSKGFAKTVIPVYSFILIVLIIFTFFVHWKIMSYLLDLFLGASLIFMVYVGLVIVLFDFEVSAEEVSYYYEGEYNSVVIKPKKYWLTLIWNIILIVSGLIAIYTSNDYRSHYSFECTTFLIDRSTGVYHVEDNDNDCEIREDAESLVPMKGYEIEKLPYSTLCNQCRGWQKEMSEQELEYLFDR